MKSSLDLNIDMWSYTAAESVQAVLNFFILLTAALN